MKNIILFYSIIIAGILLIQCDPNSPINSSKVDSRLKIDNDIKKGDSLFNKGLIKESLVIYQNAVKEAKNVNYTKAVSIGYLAIGNYYYQLSNPTIGSKYLYLSEQYAKGNPDILMRINIIKGFILFFAKSYDESEKKFKTVIELSKQSKDKNEAIKFKDRSYINIGNIYMNQEKYDSALEYYHKGYRSPDIANRIGSSINIAEIFLLNNKIDSANIYLNFAQNNIHNIQEKLLFKHVNNGLNGVKGFYLIKIGEYNKAIELLKKNNENSTTYYNSDELLGMAYAHIGNTDSSTHYFMKNFNSKFNHKRADINAHKATSIINNDEKLDLHKKQKKQEKTYFVYIGLSILLILALLFMLYYRHKMTKQRTQFLEFEKENLKMEKELSDLKQKHIQKQALATSIQLEQKNKFIEELRDNIKNDKDFNINTYLKNEQFIDKDLIDIHDIVKEIHPNFFKELNNKAQTKLSNLDIKYAAFIYMNIDNPRIAAILKVDPKTVSVTKYRLKQKLGLPKDVDLEGFIRGLFF